MMKTRITPLLNFIATTATRDDAGFSWDIPDKRQQNAHKKCLIAISGALQMRFRKQFPHESIFFSVRETLNTENQKINTTLLVESDSFSFQLWESFIETVTALLTNSFYQVDVISSIQNDRPIYIQTIDRNQTNLPLEESQLDENQILVDSAEEKKIIEELKSLAQTQSNTQCELGPNSFNLKAMAKELPDLLEGQDIIQVVYITMVCARTFRIEILIATDKRPFSCNYNSVKYSPEMFDEICGILQKKCAAKIRFSTFSQDNSQGKCKVILYAIEEIILILPEHSIPQTAPDFFNNSN